MIKQIFKKAKELVKEEMQFNKDIKRLSALDLDMIALQRIVDKVATNNVEIEIRRPDGNIIIRPNIKNEIGFKSFKDQFEEEMKRR